MAKNESHLSAYKIKCGISRMPTTVTEGKKVLRWGTYGKPASPPVKYVRLIDMSTDHILNILFDSKYRGHGIYPIIKITMLSILKDRGYDRKKVNELIDKRQGLYT